MSQHSEPSQVQRRLGLPVAGRGDLQGCHPRATTHKIEQEINSRNGRGFKDHLTEVLQSGGPHVEFDLQVSFGLVTVLKIGVFHIKIWISDSLKILEDLKINTGPR